MLKRAATEHRDISIHAPRAGCDSNMRHPARRFLISIHAPRAGCDERWWRCFTVYVYFNPRTPCGVRPSAQDAAERVFDFNPRTPCGVRHRFWRGHRQLPEISIHAPRAGCDATAGDCGAATADFNPRTPCGVRHVKTACIGYPANFNPRTPCGVRHYKRCI